MSGTTPFVNVVSRLALEQSMMKNGVALLLSCDYVLIKAVCLLFLM